MFFNQFLLGFITSLQNIFENLSIGFGFVLRSLKSNILSSICWPLSISPKGQIFLVRTGQNAIGSSYLTLQRFKLLKNQIYWLRFLFFHNFRPRLVRFHYFIFEMKVTVRPIGVFLLFKHLFEMTTFPIRILSRSWAANGGFWRLASGDWGF